MSVNNRIGRKIESEKSKTEKIIGNNIDDIQKTIHLVKENNIYQPKKSQSNVKLKRNFSDWIYPPTAPTIRITSCLHNWIPLILSTDMKPPQTSLT